MEIDFATGPFLVITDWARAKIRCVTVIDGYGGTNAIAWTFTIGEGIRKPIFDNKYGKRGKLQNGAVVRPNPRQGVSSMKQKDDHF